MRYEKLAEPGKIGNLTLKNRIVIPPINNNYPHAAFMSEESIDFYVSKAEGGAGLVIIEATSVDYPRSRSVLNPAIDDEKYIPGIKAIADGCHKYGAKAMVQLSHVGRQSRKMITGMDPVAPSAISSASPLYPDMPKVLTVEDIHEIAEKFGKGAEIAKKAGLDGVELILGHGYLINQFLCPYSNLRTDEYAGFMGGVKFISEIVESIQKHCGKDYPIIGRMNADDFIKENGNNIVDAELLAQELEKMGVAALSVSGGMRDSELSFNDHSSGQPKGAWISLGDRVKRTVNIPVIIVKRFDADLAEKTLKNGQADFIAFGKQCIADSGFANKILEDRVDDMLPCTSCCQGCYDELWMKLPIECTVNPRVGKKIADLKVRDAKKREPKKVLIVGAGPSGCETALELARMGHSVTIIDKNNFLGGSYFYCSYTELKAEVAGVFKYFGHEFNKLGVDVRLNTVFSKAMVEAEGFQVVIDATGSEFVKPAIEGMDRENVISPKEALDGSHDVGKYVVVVACSYGCPWTCHKVSHEIPDDIVGLKTSESYACGAGHAAADVAEDMADRGKKVIILTERDEFVPGMGFTNRGNMFKRFFPKNVSVSTKTKIKKVIDGGLLCEKNGVEFKVSADTIIMSTKLKAVNGIEDQVKDLNVTYYKVGDSEKIGNALKAFHAGFDVADKV